MFLLSKICSVCHSVGKVQAHLPAPHLLSHYDDGIIHVLQSTVIQ